MNKLNVTEFLNKNNKDQVFTQDSPNIGDFSFNDKVANVFDDMVSRSVPYYEEMQRMACELAEDFAKPRTNLYDIGCSTATTMLALNENIDPTVKFIGVDNSAAMIAKAQEKIDQAGVKRQIELITGDLHQDIKLENASVITMLLTLQFARPLYRERIMRNIFEGLNEQGSLILIEKLTCKNTVFNRLYIDHYYDFKRRNGYSETEIAKKREALENVLIPYRLDENIELLENAGFRQIEVFFRWYNFCGIIAVK